MAESLPETTGCSVCSGDAKQELWDQCKSIWKQMEECHNKLLLLETDTALAGDTKLSLLLMRAKALTAEYNQWQKRSPEILSINPDILLASGKEELRKVKNDLNTLLLTLKSKNEKLDEDLKREQQWLDEQQHILDTLTGMEEEMKTQDEDISKRVFSELQHEMLKLKTFKKEILNALSEFLDEHFPPPEEKNQKSSEEPAAELITLTEILEILINRLMNKPHEPYVTIRDSFWPPYIELLLRYGIALRHPEDPSRIRLEAFHL